MCSLPRTQRYVIEIPDIKGLSSEELDDYVQYRVFLIKLYRSYFYAKFLLIRCVILFNVACRFCVTIIYALCIDL